MAGLMLIALRLTRLLGVLVLLLPMLPLPTVLALERWVVSKYEFSLFGVIVFRVAYLVWLFLASYLTFAMGVMVWDKL